MSSLTKGKQKQMPQYRLSIFCWQSDSKHNYLLHPTHHNIAHLRHILASKRIDYYQLISGLHCADHGSMYFIILAICSVSAESAESYLIKPSSAVMRSPGTTKLSVSQSIMQWLISMRDVSFCSSIQQKYNHKIDQSTLIFEMNKYGKENRMSRVQLPEFEGGSLQEYIEVLYSHQKTCEKTGKYMEAETAKRRLTKVKEELQKQRKQELLLRFEEEKRQVEMAHLEEISHFNQYWDGKMMDYQKEAERMESESIDRHQKQLIEFEEEIQRSLCQCKKESGEMINLRKIEENLAKQQKYVEAHKVQRQIQSLEKTEFEKWNMAKNGKVKNLMGQLKTKQDNELSAFLQKIQQGFEEQKKIRNSEYDKLVQKYQNFIKQLDNQHHQEIIKFDKTSKLQSSINFSRCSMSRALQSKNQ